MLCRWIPKAHAHAHAHYFLRLSITGIPLSIFGDWSWIMATIATLMTICWAYSQLHLLLIFLKNHLRMVLFETIKKLLVCINTYIFVSWKDSIDRKRPYLPLYPLLMLAGWHHWGIPYREGFNPFINETISIFVVWHRLKKRIPQNLILDHYSGN